MTELEREKGNSDEKGEGNEMVPEVEEEEAEEEEVEEEEEKEKRRRGVGGSEGRGGDAGGECGVGNGR